MTYKQKTLKACKELSDKYRKPKGKEFFSNKSCPLCQIYLKRYDGIKFTCTCKGCFMADKSGNTGCCYFKTYQLARNIYWQSFPPSSSMKEIFELRAKFFDKMIKELKEYPARKFVPLTWTYFKISRAR